MATREENKNLFRLAWKLGGSSFIHYAIGWMERDSHKDMGSAARSYLKDNECHEINKAGQGAGPDKSTETNDE